MTQEQIDIEELQQRVVQLNNSIEILKQRVSMLEQAKTLIQRANLTTDTWSIDDYNKYNETKEIPSLKKRNVK